METATAAVAVVVATGTAAAGATGANVWVLAADEAARAFLLDAGRTLTIRSAAERNSLWSLGGALEKTLVAQFQPDYVAQLERARARAEERAGGW